MPCCAHVLVVQLAWPHWLATPPPPHESRPEHVPQSMSAPQPSLCMPHVAPICAHVRGVHAGTVQVPFTTPGVG